MSDEYSIQERISLNEGCGYVVVWRAYNDWKVTSAIFPNKKRAEKHIEKYLAIQDYNTDMQIIEIKWNA
jgi:hypothetical protein